MEPIYNSHIHLFNKQHLPKRFVSYLQRKILDLIANDWAARKLGTHAERYHRFGNIGRESTYAGVFENIQGYYPRGTKFIALALDMDYMIDGKPDRKIAKNYHVQLQELNKFYHDSENREVIRPFVCADPRRANVFELVKEYVEEHAFSGIKISPPLGYYPFDERLDEVYAYAEKHEIPVLTHCSRGGIYYRKKLKTLTHPKTGVVTKGKNKDITETYADPNNYKYVLEKFPKLKLCLAHFGGNKEWENHLLNPKLPDADKSTQSWLSVIKELIKDNRYPNVYTDISYTMHDTRFLPYLKLLLEDEDLQSHILYGSDFYMTVQETSERMFSVNTRVMLGEHLYTIIAKKNPVNYLNRIAHVNEGV